jgi:hypothetical protein
MQTSLKRFLYHVMLISANLIPYILRSTSLSTPLTFFFLSAANIFEHNQKRKQKKMLATRSQNIIKEAPKVWKHLNGVINIYKPSGVSMAATLQILRHNICRGTNFNIFSNLFIDIEKL